MFNNNKSRNNGNDNKEMMNDIFGDNRPSEYEEEIVSDSFSSPHHAR